MNRASARRRRGEKKRRIKEKNKREGKKTSRRSKRKNGRNTAEMKQNHQKKYAARKPQRGAANWPGGLAAGVLTVFVSSEQSAAVGGASGVCDACGARGAGAKTTINRNAVMRQGFGRKGADLARGPTNGVYRLCAVVRLTVDVR